MGTGGDSLLGWDGENYVQPEPTGSNAQSVVAGRDEEQNQPHGPEACIVVMFVALKSGSEMFAGWNYSVFSTMKSIVNSEPLPGSALIFPPI